MEIVFFLDVGKTTKLFPTSKFCFNYQASAGAVGSVVEREVLNISLSYRNSKQQFQAV